MHLNIPFDTNSYATVKVEEQNELMLKVLAYKQNAIKYNAYINYILLVQVIKMFCVRVID